MREASPESDENSGLAHCRFSGLRSHALALGNRKRLVVLGAAQTRYRSRQRPDSGGCADTTAKRSETTAGWANFFYGFVPLGKTLSQQALVELNPQNLGIVLVVVVDSFAVRRWRSPSPRRSNVKRGVLARCLWLGPRHIPPEILT
jgi:hypothetical protein